MYACNIIAFPTLGVHNARLLRLLLRRRGQLRLLRELRRGGETLLLQKHKTLEDGVY